MKIFNIKIFLTVFLAQAANLENLNFSSAGVIPRVQINNEYYLLLGKEEQGAKAGTFDGFCGRRENNETSWQTASREFYEESIGALGDFNYYKKLKSNIAAKIILIRPNNKIAVNYLIDLNDQQYLKLVKNFYRNLTKPNLRDEFKEKTQLALFNEEKINSKIKNGTKYQNFTLDALLIDSKLRMLRSHEQIYDFLPKMLEFFYKN